MLITRLTEGYMIAVSTVSLLALAYIYVFPPQSMFTSREGIPYFSPKVAHPETGDPLTLNELVRHYRGD